MGSLKSEESSMPPFGTLAYFMSKNKTMMQGVVIIYRNGKILLKTTQNYQGHDAEHFS